MRNLKCHPILICLKKVEFIFSNIQCVGLKKDLLLLNQKTKKTTVVLYFNGKGVIIANKDWEHSNRTFTKTREEFFGEVK